MRMQDKDKLTRQAIHELARVANQFARSENLPIEIDENTSITTREAHMIQAIGDTPDATVTEMAARFGVSKSAASQLIERLREKGYVEKAPAPCSNKELRLTLTPSGWNGYRAHERLHGEDMERLCRCVDAFRRIRSKSYRGSCVRSETSSRSG
jgi:DNA-binding MarR family transcriptional regulator